jgi:hypothetical protein
MPSSKSKSSNKKNKNKNVWHKNPTRFYCNNETKIEQGVIKKRPKTNVEQIENNVRFHFYLYPLGTQFKEVFK